MKDASIVLFIQSTVIFAMTGIAKLYGITWDAFYVAIGLVIGSIIVLAISHLTK